LTCEITPKIPVNLLRAGRILTFEPPPGVRANLLRTFATIPPARMMRPPNERARLYFILAWFHAIIQVCSAGVDFMNSFRPFFRDKISEGSSSLIIFYTFLIV
jgi:hypothetical protein